MKGSKYKRSVLDQDTLESIDPKIEETNLTAMTTRSLASNKASFEFDYKLKKFFNNNSKVMKDIDYVELTKMYEDVFRLNITNFERKLVLDMIERDVKFLSDQNLMDYSILIGIE